MFLWDVNLDDREHGRDEPDVRPGLSPMMLVLCTGFLIGLCTGVILAMVLVRVFG